MSGLTFDQLNAYLLYKNKVLITKKILTNPKHLTSSV